MSAPFRHRLRVRWSDCDQQGVVFYPNYLVYFDDAITELWREAIGSYAQIAETGADMVVGEAAVRYRASATFDDELEILVTILRLGSTSMTTRLTVERDGETLCEGELRHVFVDPRTFEKRDMPDQVRRALERFTAEAEQIA
jgi:acyl-CoA thioester hydrolase